MNEFHRWTRLAAIAAALALLAGACGPGTQTTVEPPGATPPPGNAPFTDQAGRLYALVASRPPAPPSTSLWVFDARDATLVGSTSLDPIDVGGFAVAADGTILVGDRLGPTLRAPDPDPGSSGWALPLGAPPRALAAFAHFDAFLGAYSDVAMVADTAAGTTQFPLFPQPNLALALPTGGTPRAASFSSNGSLLAIARDDGAGAADVLIAGILSGAPPLLEQDAALSAPDACGPHADDVRFAAYGSSPSEWRVLDLACDRLYAGGATQDASATIVLGSAAAPAIAAGERLAMDGFANDAFVSDGAGVEDVDLGSGVVAPMLPGPTTSIALANGGTILWAATSTTSGRPALIQLDSTGVSSFASLPITGADVRDLLYFDRPPRLGQDSAEVSLCGGAPSVSFDTQPFDPDGDPVSVTLQRGPSGATFDGRTFSWQASARPGIYPLTFDLVSGDFLVEDYGSIDVASCPHAASGGAASPSCGCRCSIGGDSAPARAPIAGVTMTSLLLSALAVRRRRHA